MIGAFLAVTLQSFKNRIVARLRRLKQPRYALGGLVGIGYFFFLFFRNRRASVVIAHFGMNEVRLDFAALVVFLLLLFAWALPSDSGGLTFSEAEIAFLFPAPLRRGQLLLYKLLRAQPQILMSALAFSLLSGSGERFVGFWITFTALGVYFTLVSLGRARLKLMHIGFLARLVGTLLIFGVVVNVAFTKNGVFFARRMNDPTQISALVHSFFAQPFIRGVLYVPRFFSLSVFAPNAMQMVLAWGVLFVLTAMFFGIASMLNVSFEEASIARSQRRNARRERMQQERSGRYVRFPRLRSPFRLAERGRPEIAILWKNVIATMRMSLGTIIALSAVFVVILGLRIFVHGADAGVMSALFLGLACMLPLLGPVIFANDLRLDLSKFEMLKSYPLSGEMVVAAEIAAPLVIVSAFEIAALLCFLTTSTLAANSPFSFVNSTQAVACALIAAVPLCGLQLLFRNAAPLLFPAWSTRPKEDVRGFAVGGQRLLMLAGNLALLAVFLIPVAIVFIPSFMVANHFFSGTPIASALMTVPASAVMAGEVWLGIRFLGSRFDALDVSIDFDAVSAV